MNTNPESTNKIVYDCLSDVLFGKDAQDEDNIINLEEIQSNAMNYTEVLRNSSNNLESSNDSSTIDNGLLHYYTDMSRKEFCSTLLKILRDAHISKLHANQLLSFIHSTFPTPNTVPTRIEQVLEFLEIDDYLLKKYILCTVCNNILSGSDTCSKCLCSDHKCFGVVYDMNIEQLIKKIYIRLKMDINEYREHLRSMNDIHEMNDIGFNKIYQQLLKENMNKTFITFLLHLDGVTIDHNHHIDVKFLCITGDSPALRNVLNFIGHGEPVLRYSSTYAKESAEAEETKTIVYGHKGTSILQNILDTKLPEAIIIDYQHVSLLRHTKTVLSTIYKQLKPSHRRLIDIKLKNQCFPHFFNRRMKPFKNLSFIKAVELRNILLYGFLPLSYEFINREQLAHFALFICSIRLYHSQPPMFGRETATIANRLFKQYYKDHKKFYHLIQHYVLHLHFHYGNQYVNYGSLANIGCFSQEDLLGHISSNTHGTRYYDDQIVHYYNIDFSLNNRLPQTEYKVYSKPIDLDANFIIDNHSIIIQHHNQICKCLNTLKCISIYRRCIIRNNTFHSLLYKRRTKSKSYFISYYKSTDDDEKYFGFIHLFFYCKDTTYAIIERFQNMQKFSSSFRSSSYFDLLKKPLDSCFSIVSKEPSDIFDIVEIGHVIKHCIVFDFGQHLIITEVSAYHEHD
ncbi:unnamed protein product [Rotaria sordida]|uniref:Uncharacterized protein n=1 Tax=Rotaria sordida TaxID=392033 RepID=A0A815IH30_9BILA|nr:unnamed protein product [Rotaria sordida]